MPASRPSDPRLPERVLFTCSLNGNRALLAASLLTHHLRAPVHVGWAHGSPPQVHPLTLAVLRERGVKLVSPTGYPLGQPCDPFDLVIDLACGCEGRLGHTFPHRRLLPWPTGELCTQTQPAALPVFRRARDLLERHVVELLDGHEPVPS